MSPTGRPSEPIAAMCELLSRERVLSAALRFIDEHGLDAFSMRRLAGELGVSTNSR